LNAQFGEKQGLENQHINGGCGLFVAHALQGQSTHTCWAVRRITSTEAERLQGVPDGFTQISWRGKPANQCPDGPRYKAIGNSMAVNVMSLIGERIDMVENLIRAGKI
jgi:site-specific DNA-cytosine methylase